MAHKLGKKLLSWDESIDDEVRYRLDRQEEELKEGDISEDERKTEKDVEQEIYADQDFWASGTHRRLCPWFAGNSDSSDRCGHTIRLIGSNANNVFSAASSSIQ